MGRTQALVTRNYPQGLAVIFSHHQVCVKSLVDTGLIPLEKIFIETRKRGREVIKYNVH
jgi:hypothetical protein